MMKSSQIFTSTLGALCAGLCLTYAAAIAQTSPEEQAKTILQLFESGQKDTAYALLEPLKKSARFVPAVIYTRAQMTPDDRALGLYKELIALDPDGPWAEKGLYQLVARYADKRDSLAAYVWADVLRTNYAQSVLIKDAEGLLADVKSWRTSGEDLAETPAGRNTPSKPSKPVGTKPTGTTASKPSTTDTSRASSSGKPAGDKPGSGKSVAEGEDEGTPSSTGTAPAKVMRGYALQVGLYPTKTAAQTKAAELAKKKLTAVALPKTVDGKKRYALVVGPYPSVAEATKKKATINSACACSSFVVQVQ